MDIWYETFLYFAKHKDKSIKNNHEKKKKSSYETLIAVKTYMLCLYRLAAYKFYYTYESVNDKTNKITCTQQPGHPPSLISVFPIRMNKAWVLGYHLSAQANLSLC